MMLEELKAYANPKAKLSRMVKQENAFRLPAACTKQIKMCFL